MKSLLTAVTLGLLLMPCLTLHAQTTHDPQLATRLRLTDSESGNQQAQVASVLLRASLQSQWQLPLDRPPALESLLQIDHLANLYRKPAEHPLIYGGSLLLPERPGTYLNQAWLRARLGDSHATLGRQRLEFDNQRFIGSDNFWQIEQTFDALATDIMLATSSHLHYVYIGQVKRIYGDRHNPAPSNTDYAPPSTVLPDNWLADHRHNTHLLRLEWNEWDFMQGVLYHYRIDNRDLPSATHITTGVRYRLHYRSGQLRYRAELELAQQQRTGLSENPSPGYHLVELALGYQRHELHARREVLGSDQGAGFITPLGSVYRFQGITGLFAYTPNGGVINHSLGTSSRASPWRVDISAHSFHAQAQHYRYGRELSVDLHYLFTRQHRLLFRLGQFRADAAYLTDQRRVSVDYSYGF